MHTKRLLIEVIQRWLTLHATNVDVNICINVAGIILSLTATNVGDHLLDLVIWRNTIEPVLVVNMFQLLRNDVLIRSSSYKSLGGAVEEFTVNMKEANHLSALKKAISVFTPVMTKYQQEHHAYKFQIAVTIVFHKAVDPAVVTHQPVTLTSEMDAVYSDAYPPLEDVYRQLLNFIQVYEHNGSGWVFSNFASL